jgi:5-methylcytosine-specific restriction endonuclease McrA
MNKIEKIRLLLDELEKETSGNDDATFAHNFDALELPSIICSIVDNLQPLLRPYEAAIYWFLFRHSIVETGQQYVRASTKGMKKGIITSSNSQDGHMSYSSVQEALAQLEVKGVISKAGETTREGTLYKVNLPEEIDLCQQQAASRIEEVSTFVDEAKELDYYNIAENRLKIFERDHYRCHYCNKQLTRFTGTLDHILPVSRGGDNSFENLITSCLHCNARRGNRPVMEMYGNSEE